jgi:TRAP-type C4-dicarboxylate transport system substrate-binding protein
MKRKALVLLCFLLTFALVLGGCGGSDQDAAEQKEGENVPTEQTSEEVYDLSVVLPYMDKHPTIVNGFFPWFEEMKEKSDGRLNFTPYNPNVLVPERDLYDSTISGMVDFGLCYCSNQPGRFPLNTLMELPLIAPSAEAGSLVTWELYNKYPEWQKEFEETEMLFQWASATYNLHTRDKHVKTLEDLKGMKIIGWSPVILDIIKQLGANPIEITALDTYMAIERGTADGVLCPLAPLKSYKITDAAKYHTIVDIGVGPFYAVMNKELFNSMPEDLQKLLKENTGEKLSRVFGQTLDQGAIEDAKWMMDNGHEFYVIPDEEKEKWFEAIQPLHDAWVKDMEKKGYANAREILDEAIRLGKEFGEKTGRGFVEN